MQHIFKNRINFTHGIHNSITNSYLNTKKIFLQVYESDEVYLLQKQSENKVYKESTIQHNPKKKILLQQNRFYEMHFQQEFYFDQFTFYLDISVTDNNNFNQETVQSKYQSTLVLEDFTGTIPLPEDEFPSDLSKDKNQQQQQQPINATLVLEDFEEANPQNHNNLNQNDSNAKDDKQTQTEITCENLTSSDQFEVGVNQKKKFNPCARISQQDQFEKKPNNEKKVLIEETLIDSQLEQMIGSEENNNGGINNVEQMQPQNNKPHYNYFDQPNQQIQHKNDFKNSQPKPNGQFDMNDLFENQIFGDKKNNGNQQIIQKQQKILMKGDSSSNFLPKLGSSNEERNSQQKNVDEKFQRQNSCDEKEIVVEKKIKMDDFEHLQSDISDKKQKKTDSQSLFQTQHSIELPYQQQEKSRNFTISQDDIDYEDQKKFRKAAFSGFKQDEIPSRFKLRSLILDVVDKEKQFDILIMKKPLRTVKFLIALQTGASIVTEEWLTDSLQERKQQSVVNYYPSSEQFKEQFRLDMSDIIRNRNKFLKQRLETTISIFLNKIFYVNDDVEPAKDDIETLIQNSGGQLRKSKKAKNVIEVIRDDQQPKQKQINAGKIIECIMFCEEL